PAIRCIGVDPVGSIYAYWNRHGHLPPKDELGFYLIDGIGQSYMPESCWPETIDEVVTVDDRTAYRSVFALARAEAIFTGSSGAAAAWAAREVARKLPADAIVVTLLPDSGERYLSKLNREWLIDKGLIGADEQLIDVAP
ncbi:MAG: pyridoxal-phosphate dependent enzyme, partial [Thermoanaerobaculia bacterium]